MPHAPNNTAMTSRMIPHFTNFRKIEKMAPMINNTATIHKMFCKRFSSGRSHEAKQTGPPFQLLVGQPDQSVNATPPTLAP